jgi:hypothetical protein
MFDNISLTIIIYAILYSVARSRERWINGLISIIAQRFPETSKNIGLNINSFFLGLVIFTVVVIRIYELIVKKE